MEHGGELHNLAAFISGQFRLCWFGQNTKNQEIKLAKVATHLLVCIFAFVVWAAFGVFNVVRHYASVFDAQEVGLTHTKPRFGGLFWLYVIDNCLSALIVSVDSVSAEHGVQYQSYSALQLFYEPDYWARMPRGCHSVRSASLARSSCGHSEKGFLMLSMC